MSKLTAAIIEDEVPAARLLSSIITRLRPDWRLPYCPEVWKKPLFGSGHILIRIFCFWTFSYRTVIHSTSYLPHNLLH